MAYAITISNQGRTVVVAVDRCLMRLSTDDAERLATALLWHRQRAIKGGFNIPTTIYPATVGPHHNPNPDVVKRTT